MFSILSRPALKNTAFQNIRFKSTHVKGQTYKTPLLTWVSADFKRLAVVFANTSIFMSIVFGWPYMYKYFMSGKSIHEFEII